MNLVESSRQFHNSDMWFIPGVVPVVNTLSESVRVVSAVALATLSAFRTVIFGSISLAQALVGSEITFKDQLADSLGALFYNIGMVAYGCFAAIPIIGNLPAWHKIGLACESCVKGILR